MAEIIQIDGERPDPELIRRACSLLDAGELVVLPTETVYGIACAPKHLAKLYCAKERDCGKPIAQLAAGFEQVESLGAEFGKAGRILASKFWPGPLTLVLKTPEGTTGFRVPDHPVALAVAKAFKRPVALTSANKSGGEDAVQARDAYESLKDCVSLFLDCGETSMRTPSTVVLCLKNETRILREGALSSEEISACL